MLRFILDRHKVVPRHLLKPLGFNDNLVQRPAPGMGALSTDVVAGAVKKIFFEQVCLEVAGWCPSLLADQIACLVPAAVCTDTPNPRQ